jgi:hypothetical protein
MNAEDQRRLDVYRRAEFQYRAMLHLAIEFERLRDDAYRRASNGQNFSDMSRHGEAARCHMNTVTGNDLIRRMSTAVEPILAAIEVPPPQGETP